MEKHSESRLSVFHDVPTFSRTCIFFLLIFSLLTLLTSAFQLSILSEVSLLNFLRLYVQISFSYIYIYIIYTYKYVYIHNYIYNTYIYIYIYYFYNAKTMGINIALLLGFILPSKITHTCQAVEAGCLERSCWVQGGASLGITQFITTINYR